MSRTHFGASGACGARKAGFFFMDQFHLPKWFQWGITHPLRGPGKYVCSQIWGKYVVCNFPQNLPLRIYLMCANVRIVLLQRPFTAPSGSEGQIQGVGVSLKNWESTRLKSITTALCFNQKLGKYIYQLHLSWYSKWIFLKFPWIWHLKMLPMDLWIIIS